LRRFRLLLLLLGILSRTTLPPASDEEALDRFLPWDDGNADDDDVIAADCAVAAAARGLEVDDWDGDGVTTTEASGDISPSVIDDGADLGLAFGFAGAASLSGLGRRLAFDFDFFAC
jgi:hypothetical protein